MIENNIVTISSKRIFVSYKLCPLFQEVPDVPVSIPELPIPGNLFSGEFFLPEEKQQVFRNMNHLFFVKDLAHRFAEGTQHIIIVLTITPRNLTAVKSTKN